MTEPVRVSASTWALALRTPTLPPATRTNTVLIIGESMVIVEPATPFPDERSRLDAFIEQHAADGHEIRGILVTHHHVDHVGYVAELKQKLGVPLLAHAETAARIDVEVDELLVDGSVLDLGGGVEVEAVHTPGHAPGHLVYVEHSTHVAYAGDMVAGEGFILIDPQDSGSMRQYLDSLDRMQTLGLTKLVPAHGPVIEDPGALLSLYSAHRLAREAKVLAAVRKTDAFERILEIAYDDAPPQAMPLATRSLQAHLDKLVEDRAVVVDGDLYRMP